jgi:hypothetical protein
LEAVAFGVIELPKLSCACAPHENAKIKAATNTVQVTLMIEIPARVECDASGDIKPVLSLPLAPLIVALGATLPLLLTV